VIPDSTVEEFKNNQKLFIAGSTWPQDEKLVAALAHQHPDWKFIFAPHEIKEEQINRLIELLPPNTSIKFSQLKTHHSLLTTHQTLIIDNIGMLSSLYQYGDIAYIGGGFGVGIHNTLEAAAFGLPVIVGPEYSKFKEAKDLIAIKAGFSIANENELKGIVDTLTTETAFYNNAAKKAGDYVRENTGATWMIVDYVVR
jgi:3-deoxy-D-manno-octulosonic-acid transferase